MQTNARSVIPHQGTVVTVFSESSSGAFAAGRVVLKTVLRIAPTLANILVVLVVVLVVGLRIVDLVVVVVVVVVSERDAVTPDELRLTYRTKWRG